MERPYKRTRKDLEPFVRTYTNNELNTDLESELLIEAVKRILNNLNKEDLGRKGFFHSLKRDLYTVDQKMNLIRERIVSDEIIQFDSLFSEDRIKSEVIVTFLAILELLKLKVVKIKQDNLFDRIEIIKKQSSGV